MTHAPLDTEVLISSEGCVLVGLPQHRKKMEDLALIGGQLEAAVAAQDNALLLAELRDKLQRTYREMAPDAKGDLLLCR